MPRETTRRKQARVKGTGYDSARVIDRRSKFRTLIDAMIVDAHTKST